MVDWELGMMNGEPGPATTPRVGQEMLRGGACMFS